MSMSINLNFYKEVPKTTEKDLLVRLSNSAKDEIFKEGGVRYLNISLPKDSKFTRRKYFLLVRRMIMAAKNVGAKRIIIDLNHKESLKIAKEKLREAKIDLKDAVKIFATNCLMANYKYVVYKETPKDGWNFVEEICFVGNVNAKIKEFLNEGVLIGESVNRTRDLANTPGGDMTPSILVEEIKKDIKGLPIVMNVLDEKEMQRLNMNAILAVGRGSDEESKFIVLEYWGTKKKENPIVLVGKGVTYDTGGLSIKLGDGMLGMNMDMSGGAAVLQTLILGAKLKLKKNIIALVPAVENGVSGKSYRPGDIIKSMSGKTIEVLNTDAEGRVILADALTYAKQYNPELVIDVATLTGAAIISVGDRANLIFSRDEKLIKNTQELGEKSGEYVWPLPMWEEYENDVKGSVGDVTNIHNKKNRQAGSIMGAVFLLQFAKDFKKWMHIDMAPRMEASSDEFLSSGAVGSPVRLLLEFLRK